MKNTLTALAAGAALSLSLPLAAAAQTQNTPSVAGGSSLSPGSYEVIDNQGREVGRLVYGGGSTLRLQVPSGHIYRTASQSMSATAANSPENSANKSPIGDNFPAGVPETP